MGSLIGIFNTASQALLGDQVALDTTSSNIANQNTAGYVRRSVSWNTSDVVTLNGASGSQSPTVAVTAQRNPSLDSAVAAATAGSSSASALQTALNTLQNVFSIGSSGTESSGIETALSGFFTAAQALAADPSSSSARQAAFAAAQSVSAAFQQTSAQLTQQTATLNDDISGSVDTINQTSAQIAGLNRSIASSADSTTRATLVDQRTSLIEQLSAEVGVQQTQNSDGSVSLFTSSGGALVVGGTSNAVSTTSVAGVVRLQVQGSDITNGLSGGSVGGAIAARDGAVASTQASLDTLAASFANAVNAVNSNGKLANGNTGGPIFTVPASGSGAAAAINVSATSGDAFAAAGQTEGDGGNSNANALAALQSSAQVNGDTFDGALSSLISSVGSAASSAGTASTAATASLTAASAARESVSGVSLDTEAANLTTYQRSYEAEAKLLSILDSVMASAINLGTETAVS